MLMMVMMIMVVKQHQQRGMQDEDGSQRNPVSCSQECRSLQQRETRTFISLHPSTVQTCNLAIFLYPHVFKHSAEPKNAKVQQSKDEGRNTADTAFAPSQWRLFKQSVSSHSSSAVLKYLFVVQYCKIFKQSVSFHSSSFKVFVCCVVLYNIQAEGVWCRDCPHSSPCTLARRKCCKLEPKPRQA